MAYRLKDTEGNPVKYQDKEVFAYDKTGSVKAISRETRTLTIIGTDETKDRDGDIISIKGWQMDNFLKNPVFLYAHNYSSVPIGSATKIIKRKNPGRLEFVEKFPTEGLYPFADMIFELFNEKILNASSVGFIPTEWEPVETADAGKNSDDMMGSRGRRYLKQELLELSACPVPSNPNALQNSIKFMKSHSADEIALLMSGQQDFSIKRDEVLGELEGKEIEFIDEDEIKSFVPANYEVTKEEEEELITAKGAFEEGKSIPVEETEEAKTGAVLNLKNKNRLVDASNLIIEVLKDAGVSDQSDTTSESITFEDIMEQLAFLRSEVLNLTETIKEIKSAQPPSNEPLEEAKKRTLLSEYEKILSQKDNENAVEDKNQLSPEEEEIIKQVIKGLTKSLNDEEEILKQVTLNLQSIMKEK